jgi:diguanylate cyclase (GGDEF)-like protein
MSESIIEDILFNYLRDAIYHPSRATLDLKKLPENYQNFGKGLKFYVECVIETTTLANDLSKGVLNGKWPSKTNEIASSVKALHAMLKHLTWQTQQVAKGDYKQRVSFMGDFSEAFNLMIEQLDQRQNALLGEILVSQRKTLALAQSNSLFEAVTENISQWIVVMDRDSGEWLFFNHNAGEILARPSHEQNLREWMALQADLVGENVKKRSSELALPDGDDIQYFSVVTHPLHWYEHSALAFVFTDVSLEKERLRRLENVAYHDTLTSTYNRRYGMETLEQWLADGISFIVCFVDMDNLKYINDRFGHSEGDKYIMIVTKILRDFSPDAIICRIGGDEFMLLARGWEHEAAEERLEELRERLMNHNTDSPGVSYTPSMSYGVVSVYAGESHSPGELLGLADEKMYEYKRAHKMHRRTNFPQP